MNLRLGVMRGAFSLGGARIVSNLLGAGAILILARLLTPEDFGIVAIATAVLTVVQSCTDLSLNNALIQKENLERSHVDTAWTMALLRALIIVAFFVLASWPLAILYSNTELVAVFLVSGLTGAMIGLQNPQVWLATKSMRFGPLAIVQFSQKAVAIGFGIAFALMFQSYWAIIIGNLIGAVFASLIGYALVPYLPRFSLKKFREIWAFSGWMFFNQLLETVNWRVDQLIIGLVVPKGQLGIYAVADNLAVIPTRESIQPIRHALFPGLANLSQDVKRLARSHLLAQSSIAMLIAPLGVGLALVAEPAVAIALGDQWTAAVPFVEICAIYYALGTFSMGLQPVAMAMGQTKLLFIRQVIAVFIKVPLIVGGLMTGGLTGAALGRLVSEFIVVMIEFVFLRHLLKIPVLSQLKHHALTLAGLLAMAIVVFGVDTILAGSGIGALPTLGLLVVVGGATYFAAVFLAWRMTGRIEGPVTELMKVASRFAEKRRARRTVAMDPPTPSENHV
ncbi:lipopolysaccharide biosynthesis protein [Erythrobacter sp. THAF29]|uniref:lipopolysaccharide biosynthesis protein n=1 Tax=Erythrobacter sp. THAF29 TaxID=2587851 RepID=UPI0012680629|nr:lipopolysaccharide biosynthesis protein [Erythrobacter sp. THAF29]QFT77357.1 Lipopolysaccharide biosynthesis protein WzxC [Erythrobacter sp. THAF29]